ncbi:MAG: hypothetical protein OXF02_00565 [Simkaniaceae bacterium]|nr:hypothetical protein [Simkaniaceae bacterium]
MYDTRFALREEECGGEVREAFEKEGKGELFPQEKGVGLELSALFVVPLPKGMRWDREGPGEAAMYHGKKPDLDNRPQSSAYSRSFYLRTLSPTLIDVCTKKTPS